MHFIVTEKWFSIDSLSGVKLVRGQSIPLGLDDNQRTRINLLLYET